MMIGEHKMSVTVGSGTALVAAGAGDLDLKRHRRPGEAVIQALLFACGILSVFTTLGIIFVLAREALLFFQRPEVTVLEFLTGTVWQPQILKFGIFPLLNATILTSVIAMMVALPLGVMIAIYLSEYASPTRGILKPVLEVLAGIPTVVYGYFALTLMTPLLRSIFGVHRVEFYNVGSAGLVIGILILPLITSMAKTRCTPCPLVARGGLRAGRDPARDGGEDRCPCRALGPRGHLYRGHLPRNR